jgi:hypothetical protein
MRVSFFVIYRPKEVFPIERPVHLCSHPLAFFTATIASFFNLAQTDGRIFPPAGKGGKKHKEKTTEAVRSATPNLRPWE